MKLKKITILIISLIILQLGRIAFKYLFFIFMQRTLLTDVIISMIYMLLIISIGLFIAKKEKIKIGFFPQKFNVKYKLLTFCVFLFFIITPVITNNYHLYYLMSLIYNAIITVVFEEMIFRGFVFNELEKMSNSLIAYIISSVLFGLWHIGYIDSVIWRTSLFNPDACIVTIMFWKTITGLVIGLILGFLRYKNKNMYLSMLVHTFINTIGS